MFAKMASMNTNYRAPSLNMATNGTIPSYGALQDTATLTDRITRLRAEAAVAHVKGDRLAETAAKKELAALLYVLKTEDSAKSMAKHHFNRRVGTVEGKKRKKNHRGKKRPSATAKAQTKIIYSPILKTDDRESQNLPIERIATKAFYAAKKYRLDFDDLFGDTLANIAEDSRDYLQIAQNSDHATNKRITRALSKGVHDLLAKDYCEHHSRERNLLGDAYKKWTPRLTTVAVECYRFS